MTNQFYCYLTYETVVKFIAGCMAIYTYFHGRCLANKYWLLLTDKKLL